MYLLNYKINRISHFKTKEKENNLKRKVVGTAEVGGELLVGQQAIRSGIPRALGVRLESHSTNRKNAREILKNGGILDPNKSGSGAIRALENIQDMDGVTDINKAKGKVYITGLHKDAKDRVIQGIKMKADEGNPVLNVLARKSQRAGYRAQSGIDWDTVNAKGNIVHDDVLNNIVYKHDKKRISELEKELPELEKKSNNTFNPSKSADKKLEETIKQLSNKKSFVKEIEEQAKYAKSLTAGKERLNQSIKNSFLPTGKSLYIGGSDKYFDENFLPDFDDPKAMYSTNKVKVHGNRLSATLSALEREGEGNKLKGVMKLAKANKGRVGAGLALTGLGGLAAVALIKKGIDNIKGRSDKGKKRLKYKTRQ